MRDPWLTTRFISMRGSISGPLTTPEDVMGLNEYENRARIADLQDIAHLDRLAAEGQPSSVLNRWAARDQRSQREQRRSGLRRLLHLAH